MTSELSAQFYHLLAQREVKVHTEFSGLYVT